MNNKHLARIFQEYLGVRILPESICDEMRRAILKSITVPEAMQTIREGGYKLNVAVIEGQKVIKFTEQ